MNCAVAVLLLATVSSDAAAAWVRVGGNKNVVCYADPATITRAGNLVKMKSLLDFTAPQTDRSIGKIPYLSERDEREYDCRNERQRLLHFSLRAGQMFGGALVRSNADDGGWLAVAPASLGEALWKTACGRK